VSYELARLEEGECPSHQTAAGLLIVDGEVLLEQRPVGAAIYPDCWDIPGGHLEGDERPEDAMRREMLEELGVEVGAVSLCAVQDDRDVNSGRLYRHFSFLVSSYDGDVTPREGQTLRWWPLADAARSDSLNPLARWVIQLCLDQGWTNPA
jgi:8-oxo-dGTP diphosphatase